MSSSAVQQVIRRAVSDASFRQQLQSNPASALRGFDLTADESAAISSRDPGRLASFGVDQRVSKAFTVGGAGLSSDPMTDVPNSTGGVTRLEMESGDGSHLAVQDSGSAGSGATNAFDSGTAASGATDTIDSGIVGSGATNTLDSGTAGSGATDVLDSGTAASGATDTIDSGIVGSGATNTLDSGTAGSGATDVLDSGTAFSGATSAFDSGNAASAAAPAWRDDAQPVATTNAANAAPVDGTPESGSPLAAAESGSPTWRDDAQPLAASDDATGGASAVHDVAPADLSVGAQDDAPLASLSAVHDVAPVDLSSDSASSIHDVAPADLSATGDDVADHAWGVIDHPHPDAG